MANVPLFANAVLSDIQKLVECWVDYLRFSRQPLPLQSSTINCDLTHVHDYTITQSLLPYSGASLRSEKCKLMLAGYSKEDFDTTPLSERACIPLTYALLCSLIDMITDAFAAPLLRPLGSAIIAGFALGYACSFRVNEYLLTDPNKPTPLKHQVNSSLSYFWWRDVRFCVCFPNAYPQGVPDDFSTVLQFAKNDARGHGGPKAISRCILVSPSKDSLTVLFNFLRDHPPPLNTPLLSGLGAQLSRDLMLSQLHLLADKHGLPRSRMKMHSSVRGGALVALENQSDAVKLAQGCWSSISGMRSYAGRSIQHAQQVTDLLHDPTLCPIAYSQLQYTETSLSAPSPSEPSPTSTPSASVLAYHS